MPTTGSPTIRDIGQAEQFALRKGKSRASGEGNTLSPTLQKMPDNADKLTKESGNVSSSGMSGQSHKEASAARC